MHLNHSKEPLKNQFFCVCTDPNIRETCGWALLTRASKQPLRIPKQCHSNPTDTLNIIINMINLSFPYMTSLGPAEQLLSSFWWLISVSGLLTTGTQNRGVSFVVISVNLIPQVSDSRSQRFLKQLFVYHLTNVAIAFYTNVCVSLSNLYMPQN